MTKNLLVKMHKSTVTHSFSCECSSCLFAYYRWRHPRSRISKDIFLLVWLAFFLSKIKKDRKEEVLSFGDLKIDWEKEILPLYHQITGKEWYAQCNEQYRIIWRLRKKINIPMIILERKWDIEALPICGWDEAKESIVKYNSELDLDLFLLHASKMIKFLIKEKIDFFKSKKGIKYRDIQRRFKRLYKKDIFAILNFLEQTEFNVIKWDKKNKQVLLHPYHKENYRFFYFYLYDIYEHSVNFKKVYPRSKKVLFKHPQDFQFYYYPSLYQATKEMLEKRNKTARI